MGDFAPGTPTGGSAAFWGKHCIADAKLPSYNEAAPASMVEEGSKNENIPASDMPSAKNDVEDE